MKKIKSLLLIPPALLMIFISFVAIRGISAQGTNDAVDAIGVRIAPNPNHYSIARWYESQGFYGSPQSLIVDGYEAIRDGRTVYVNASNVVNKTIYTNIYMISYNQEPSEKTIDILGQIISRWKFNSNLELNEIDNPATCSISSLYCNDDSDCTSNSFCSKEGISSGSCVLKENINCRIDTDCPSGFFCDSDKAIITRDMKRIGRLGEMREALANYYRAKGNYPLLSSGTYLAGKTISLWPSWQQVFLADIAVSPNFIDPINRLGYCPGYEQKTCWNTEEKKFYSSPENNSLTLPEGSYAMLYSTDTNGANYSLCAVLESRHPSLGYSFSSDDQSDSACVVEIGILTGGRSDNVAPVLVDYNLSGQAGKEFNGFIKVFDENNDPLTWELSRGNDNWSSWSSDFPKILDTSNKFQKKIYASSAGLKGSEAVSTFPLNLRVSDGRGGVLEQELKVEIQDFGLFIEAQNASHVLDKERPFIYSIYVSGDNFDNPAGVFIREKTGSSLPANLFKEKSFRLVSQNRYQITFTGLIGPEYKLPESKNFELEVVARDKNNREFKKPFTLQLISEKPVLQFSCSLSARAGKKYSCFIGKTSYLGNLVSYQSLGEPEDLKIELRNDEADAYLEGIIRPILDNQIKKHEISINATSEYGAVSSRKFNLTLNTSCGDGIKQEPNSEGKGGPYNDGFEQCDGEDGIAKTAAESSVDKQYACLTGIGADVPSEITTRNYCVFKQSLAGGGYCGDGFCQTDYESKDSCSIDCGYYPQNTIDPEPEEPVDEFVAVCGDGICSSSESCYDCPDDCGICICGDHSDCLAGYYCEDFSAYCTGPENHSCFHFENRNLCEGVTCLWAVEKWGECVK